MRFLLATALLALSSVNLASAAPRFVRRQSISPSLFIDFTTVSSTIYRSTSQFQCQPVHLEIEGTNGPFQVDVIKFPFEEDKVACQEVVANVASNVTTEQKLMWLPQKEYEGDVAVRVLDAEGKAAYTVMRRIEDGDKQVCSDTSHPNWFQVYWPFILFVVVYAAVLRFVSAEGARQQQTVRNLSDKLDAVHEQLRMKDLGERETVPQTEENPVEETRLLMDEVPAYNEKTTTV